MCCYRPMAKPREMNSEQKEKALAVGQRIALAREQKGYTQASLAAKVGITSGAVAQYETGRNLPKPRNAEKIAAECGVSVEWLWEGDKAGGRMEARTTAERDALAAIRDLPSDMQEAAVAQLRALASAFQKKT